MINLRHIVEASATLQERLSERFVPVQSAPDHGLVRRRLERWCHTAARGEWSRFEQRLAAEGLDAHTACSILGNARLKDGVPLPGWALTLGEVFWIIRCREADVFSDQASRPFVELFEPFVMVARIHLVQQAGNLLELLSPAARNGLEGSLLTRLSETALPTLSSRYEIYCNVRQPLSFTPSISPNGNMYRRFMQKMCAGEWAGWLCEYAALARLLATIVDFWVESATQFLQRVNDDLKVLQEQFCPEERLCHVVDIQSDLSDPHHHGQTVMRVAFDNGLKLVYKPRNLDLDAAWFNVLRRVNQSDISMPFRCVRVLSRNEYGWMEWVDTRPCRTREQVRRYYMRAGRLLCLLYLFGGSDFQRDNVICCGDQPVLIDLETLMTPRIRKQDARLIPGRMTETVLRTHFLPHWTFDAGAIPYEAGGMEALRLSADVALSWEERSQAAEQGFRAMYRLLRQQPALIDEVLSGFDRQPVRVIFRDTRFYAELLRKSLQPRLLKYGIDRSIELEALTRTVCLVPCDGRQMPRIRAEIQMMERLDIPRFDTWSDSTDVRSPQEVIVPECFAEPCSQTVRRCFERLNADDLERQICLLRNTFDVKAVAEGEQELTSHPLTRESGVQNLDFAVGEVDQNIAESKISRQNQDFALLKNMSLKAEFLQSAIEIAEQICALAVPLESGAAAWMIPEEQIGGDVSRYNFRQCDGFLYQGSSGMSLFLAAMSTIRPDAGYADMARSALLPLIAWLQNPYIPSGTGIGAAHGLGSMVYVLTRIAGWLDSADILEHAGQIAELMTSERILTDRRRDLFDGAAGAIAGLLALYETTRDRIILDRAILCGDALLTRRVETGSGRRAWNTIRTGPVAGLSHGAGGIAYALLRLYQATGQKKFLQAAEEGIAFERTLFSPEHGNWRAFDSSAEVPDFWTTYCHGAPGIGLARLGGLPVLDTPDIRSEINIAMRTTAACSLAGVDFLCCGNFGRIDALLTAGLCLKRQMFIEMAREKAAQMLSRKKHTGGFSVFDDLSSNVINPGFFRGTAGIGYGLLRLAYPERFPCVLLWD